MFFPFVQNVILDVYLIWLICYLPKGKFVCFACQAAEKVGSASTSRLKNRYRTRHLIDRAQSRKYLFATTNGGD